MTTMYDRFVASIGALIEATAAGAHRIEVRAHPDAFRHVAVSIPDAEARGEFEFMPWPPDPSRHPGYKWRGILIFEPSDEPREKIAIRLDGKPAIALPIIGDAECVFEDPILRGAIQAALDRVR